MSPMLRFFAERERRSEGVRGREREREGEREGK